LQELSRQIIKGVTLTIPQTIKYLAKDGLVRSNQSKELLNELTGNSRKVI